MSKGGMNLYGQFVPEGTEATCNPWIVHRDENIHGPDTMMFKSERWLESEELARLYNKYSFGFGYDARTCLGKDIALMELYKAPLQFFRTFRVNMVDEERPEKYNVEGSIAFFTDMRMRIERRWAGGGS